MNGSQKQLENWSSGILQYAIYAARFMDRQYYQGLGIVGVKGWKQCALYLNSEL